MIVTRFGGKITILKDLGKGWCKVETEDGRLREWHISEFKADNGLQEIDEAIRQVNYDELRKRFTVLEKHSYDRPSKTYYIIQMEVTEQGQTIELPGSWYDPVSADKALHKEVEKLLKKQ